MSTDLEDFKLAFVRICKENHIEPQESVLKQISVALENPRKGGRFVLNLSAQSLSSKICGVLAKVFTSDRCFSEIKFNDCGLPDDGVRAIAYGISDNVACKRLDLKGNSIRGPAAESLGRMLRQNTQLASLCLEWNAVGLVETAFAVLCEGLSGNTVLQTLDLRSNQITHHGAAELANALKRNATLRSLDLRWNQIGLIGGRSLLAALEVNKTLVRLQLAGNNLPLDILKGIETAISHNADRAALTSDHQTRQRMLSSEIQALNKTQRNEMVQLMDKLDQQDTSLKHCRRTAMERICRLQDTLEERKQQFSNVAAKLSMVESELAMSESRVNELTQLLTSSKEGHTDAVKQHQNEIKRERDERNVVETRLNKELIEASEKSFQQESRASELERKCRSQQEQIFEMKESIVHLHAELKLKAAQFEETIQFERQKTKDAYRDADNLKAKEVERVKRDAEDSERAFNERLQRLESQRLELEEQLSRLKAGSTVERIQAEEQIASAKQRVRNEEDVRRAGLEEKIRVIQASRDELHAQVTQQTGHLGDLQSRNSQLAIENETFKRRVTDLQQEVHGKNAETMEEVGKVRVELNSRIERLENERRTKEELYNRVATLEKELAETSGKQKLELQSRDNEIRFLQDKMKLHDTEKEQMRVADLQRATLLQSALQNYVSKSPFAS